MELLFCNLYRLRSVIRSLLEIVFNTLPWLHERALALQDLTRTGVQQRNKTRPFVDNTCNYKSNYP